MTQSKVELARQFCEHYHEGQFRKGSNLPYHSHPIAVARTLSRYGYDDVVTQCIALLHDTVEDSYLRMDEIQDAFGYEVSNGVYILSKNKGKMADGEKLEHDDYIKRLSWARSKVKRVKIGDMIENTIDLESLSTRGIERKLADAERVYIPWGQSIAPLMVKELVKNVENFRTKTRSAG